MQHELHWKHKGKNWKSAAYKTRPSNLLRSEHDFDILVFKIDDLADIISIKELLALFSKVRLDSYEFE